MAQKNFIYDKFYVFLARNIKHFSRSHFERIKATANRENLGIFGALKIQKDFFGMQTLVKGGTKYILRWMIDTTGQGLI